MLGWLVWEVLGEKGHDVGNQSSDSCVSHLEFQMLNANFRWESDFAMLQSLDCILGSKSPRIIAGMSPAATKNSLWLQTNGIKTTTRLTIDFWGRYRRVFLRKKPAEKLAQLLTGGLDTA